MKKVTLKIITSVFFNLLFIIHLYSQTGTIAGTVKDKSRSESLIGATVMIEGTSVGAATDINGNFTINNVKPGIYNLKVSYVSYTSATIENVRVSTRNTTNISAELEENMISLGDITIADVRNTNTEISMITDIRATPFVSTGISGQQISKTLDKDASEVVKRIPGITIIDNRFLIVRGLAQRYNNVWLNNAATPSSEADVKAFSFDIIPSSLIENIMIFKSPAAEIPADFAGGFVKISTKNMPDKNGWFLSYGTGFSESTTFGTFYKGASGKTDWLGFDDGSRSLPDEMPAHLNDYETATNPVIRGRITSLGRELNNKWSASSTLAYPDQKLLTGITRKYKIGSHTIGNTTAINYSLSNNSDNMNITDYSIYNFANDKSSYLNQFTDRQYSKSARIAVMNNTSVLLGKNIKLEFRNLLNQSGTSRFTSRAGREWYNDGRYIHSEEQRYVSRIVYTGQLAGEHSLKSENTKLDWIVGYAYSNKKEPDTRRFRYIRDLVDTTQYLLIFGDQADLSSQSRMWINLLENTVSASLNYTRKMDINGFTPELKTGLYFENKQRYFNARNFGYAKGSSASLFGQTTLPVDEIFTDENINLTDGIKLMEITALSDSYTASNMQMAGYLSAKVPIGSRMNLYTGVRIERNKQTLSSYKQGSTVKVDVDRDTVNLFPSANLTYNFNDKNLLRFAYGMTVNRPEFREIAPFYYVDFELNAGIYGAPHITQAYIHNFDIRYELYPATGETFNIGAFYKKFINPIEQVILGNSPTQYSFENVKSAYAAGIEAELRKSLGFINGMNGFTMILNSSLITSKVQFDEDALARNRPLEGQSPFIVNAGLFYQNSRNDLSVSLLYNIVGRRIVAVGRPSPNQWEDIPDIYEMPRNVIDLTFSKMIGKNVEIKGGIKDILNEDVEYVQTINALVDMDLYTNGSLAGSKYFKRTQVTKSYNPGRYLSLTVSVKF